MNKLETGIIFDIERCSMYDGPGIRTTVFLKGCPLSCKWCHNPESQDPFPELAFHSNLCAYCGKCVHICPTVHEISNSTHKINYQNCTTCGKCANVCPTNALKVIGETMHVWEIIEILKKDKPYFKTSSGGLTVSGGEPFVQYNFLKELLKVAKTESIHTCIETSGFTTLEKLNGVLQYTDLFLFDYKVTNSNLHKKYIGVDRKQIQENFLYLYKRKEIILRCPIIPGYNDTIEHFQAICSIEKNYPNLKGIEIMPYHSYGKEKAAAINKPYEVTAPTVDNITKQKWKKILIQLKAGKELINSF